MTEPKAPDESPHPPELAPIDLRPTAQFLAQAESLGIEFEAGDLPRLGEFLGLLLEANKTTNLTSITDPGEAWMRHLLDALTLLPVIASLRESIAAREAATTSDQQLSIIDIGSGGGVPALPLAIVLPDVRFTLVEATGKKVEFLRHTARALKLGNVEVVQARAEAIGQDHKNHREKHDLAMARALGHLAIVIELCGPLVKRAGVVIAVKGAKAEQELLESKKALALIGMAHVETIPTPTGRLVVMEKTIKTPRDYPRRDGEPARLPLGVDREPHTQTKPKPKPKSITKPSAQTKGQPKPSPTQGVKKGPPRHAPKEHKA